ncbi:TPA: hypothetical protein ACTYMW_005365 [Enterobacter hormaechei]
MSTITKEWLQKAIADIEATRDEIPFGLDEEDRNTLAAMKLALASIEAEPVAWDYERASCITCEGPQGFKRVIEHEYPPEWAIEEGRARNIVPLYTAPPTPALSIDKVKLGEWQDNEVGGVRPEQYDSYIKSFYENVMPALVTASDSLLSELLTIAKTAANAADECAHAEFSDDSMEYSAAIADWERRSAMLQGADGNLTNEGTIPANTPCKEAPEHIWLQTAGVWPENGEFSELTWCSDNQHEDDTLYVRADVVSGNSPVVPDGWVIVPVEPTAEMISSGIAAHYERNQIQIHDRPAPGPMECAYVAMIAAVPNFREIVNLSTNNFRENTETSTKCWCRTCSQVRISDMRFVVCPVCGNKRCPHANDHRNACTGSNEPGHEGSAYPAAPKQEAE